MSGDSVLIDDDMDMDGTQSNQLLTLMRQFVSQTEKKLTEENKQLKEKNKDLEGKLKYFEQIRQPYCDSYSELMVYINEIPEANLDVTCAECKNMGLMLSGTKAKPIEIKRLALLLKMGNRIIEEQINVFRPSARTQFRSFVGNRFGINYIVMWKVFYEKK